MYKEEKPGISLNAQTEEKEIQRAKTKEELRRLEMRPKTPWEQFVDKVVLFLPVLAALLHLAEYYFLPNYRNNTHTHVYGIFIALLGGACLILTILSLMNETIFYKFRHKAPFYTFIFILLMAYDIATLKMGILMLPYFPWIDSILNAAIADRVYLLDCVKNSLILLFTGYSIGVIVGIITGILCGYSQKISYWVMPFIKILGPIPSTTWLPLVMILMSSLFKGAVFIIALGVWFSVTLATMTGITNVDREFFLAARTLGASDHQLITKIAIPSALPNIFQGMTQGMSSACTALLVAEMLGVESGLGWYITWQKSWAEFSKMYAAIIIICITFITVNWLLTRVKKGVLKWQEA